VGEVPLKDPEVRRTSKKNPRWTGKSQDYETPQAQPTL